MDETFYNNTIMVAAESVLRTNVEKLGMQFCKDFMVEHNPRGSQRGAQLATALYNYVIQELQRINGTLQYSNQQMFDIVGRYIENIATTHFNNQRNQGGGFGGGFGSGFSQPNSFGGGNFSGGFGGGFAQPTRSFASSHMRDDTIGRPSSDTPAPAAATAAPIQEIAPVTLFSRNPLDEIGDNVSFREVGGSPNWGCMTDAADRSIVVMDNTRLKTTDGRYQINELTAFARVYFDDQMDVVGNFFRIIPEDFQAEHFITRIFYNHIEAVEVPTSTFLDVQDKFLKAMSRHKDSTVYQTVIDTIDELSHARRKSIAEYLVRHINRALWLACRMTANPNTMIRFSEIEDLHELLGPNFTHPIIDLPDGRHMIADIVNNALKSALSGYTEVMFTEDLADQTVDIIRSSPVFPYSIEGVYPNKSIIPVAGTPEAKAFHDAFDAATLSHRTYLRSIRSIIISNVLGQRELSSIDREAKFIPGGIANMFNKYVVDYVDSRGNGLKECQAFDELPQSDIENGVSEYAHFLNHQEDYIRIETTRFNELHTPKWPVDQSLFAVQYKKSPLNYLLAFDVLTTLDSGRDIGAVFVQKNIQVIKPVE